VHTLSSRRRCVCPRYGDGRIDGRNGGISARCSERNGLPRAVGPRPGGVPGRTPRQCCEPLEIAPDEGQGPRRRPCTTSTRSTARQGSAIGAHAGAGGARATRPAMKRGRAAGRVEPAASAGISLEPHAAMRCLAAVLSLAMLAACATPVSLRGSGDLTTFDDCRVEDPCPGAGGGPGTSLVYGVGTAALGISVGALIYRVMRSRPLVDPRPTASAAARSPSTSRPRRRSRGGSAAGAAWRPARCRPA
jgi:hypothetical protein